MLAGSANDIVNQWHEESIPAEKPVRISTGRPRGRPRKKVDSFADDDLPSYGSSSKTPGMVAAAQDAAAAANRAAHPVARAILGYVGGRRSHAEAMRRSAVFAACDVVGAPRTREGER